MKLYPLSPVQILILLVLVAIADVFTYVQGSVVPSSLRPLTYLLFVVAILLGYFFLVKPGEWAALAMTLALVLGILAIILVIVQDVVIRYSLSWRTAVIIGGAVLGPFVAGRAYAFLTKKS